MMVDNAPAKMAETATRAISPPREGAILPKSEIWEPKEEGLAKEQQAKVANIFPRSVPVVKNPAFWDIAKP